MRWVPSLDNLENEKFFRESTIIYDKDWNEIYTIFKDGKRTNIPYSEISQSIIDATISTEDRTFFENPGIDILWLVRVGATYITWGKFGRVWWASTISQQLIKNTLLTNEVTVKRKAQEAYLSYKMNNRYSKEKILEMYLNTISFWHNANWVEQAARTFFWKSAKDVGPLGATILASVINAPTRYSPYMHRDRVMGKLEVYPTTDTTDRTILDTTEKKENYGPLYQEFKLYLSWITIDRIDFWAKICWVKEIYIKPDFARRDAFLPNDDWCTNVAFDDLGDFFGNISFTKKITIKEIIEDYTIEYTIWRKDFVAKQLFEDMKIDGETYKKIIYDGIDFEFKKYVENIKYPYFVMYIKEYLETKYGKDMDITSWLRVYTTIDPKLQEKAESIIKEKVESNKKLYKASSAALVSMDNKDGRLLAMVWWADYFDIENWGNNNMALSPRQPGSSFKPFVYAIAISKNPIWPESPVWDTDTKFWSWDPDNYDGKFLGVMTLKNALNYSRNIPAGKMYFLAWQQDEIVKTMYKMGVTTLKEEKQYSYGWPLSLWAWEIKPIELMQAYSVLANNGVKNNIYAIEKIELNDWTIIEAHEKTQWIEVFSPAASYIVNKIISDNTSRPESSYWRNALTINKHTVAAKTGTANKPPKKGSTSILPGDLWTAGYTPQITTVVWAWNVDGSAMSPKAESLNSAAPIWKAYMEFALKDLPSADWEKPKDIYTYNIVKTSGKLATKDTPKDQTVSTIMAVKYSDYDEWLREIKIDTLCNWLATEDTPPDAIKLVYIPSWKPVIDWYDPEWTSSFYLALKKWQTWSWTTNTSSETSGEFTDKPCEIRPDWAWIVNIEIKRATDTSAIIEFSWDRMIQKIRIIPEWWEWKEIIYWTGSAKSGKETIATKKWERATFTVDIIDIYGFKYSKSQTLLDIPTVIDNPTASWSIAPPKITLIKPSDENINLYSDSIFNLRFRVDISTTTREVQVFIDDVLQQTATSGEIFSIPVSSAWLSEWKHTVRITAIDWNFNQTEKTFTLTILPR